MADGDQLLGRADPGQDVAHDVVEGFLVRGTCAQHGFALDPVEFPFDTCVIQIEAFGQAGQHVLACFSVHYGKFQEELPQLGSIPTCSCSTSSCASALRRQCRVIQRWMGFPCRGKRYGRRRVRPIFKSLGLGADRSSGADSSIWRARFKLSGAGPLGWPNHRFGTGQAPALALPRRRSVASNDW